VIQLRDLEVRYEGFRLGPLTLTLEPGSQVALIGPNGAGKSTTLRGIAGLLPAYRGSVTVEGREVREAGPMLRARVGVLPERLQGFGWMTVDEQLAFLSSFYPSWDPAYARALQDRMALPGSTRLAALSRGMQVKLSLVMAEAFRPPVLLLDEPTSGIDPVMRSEILALVSEASRGVSGRTVLFSSHILEDVGAVAQRVLLLRDGQIVEDATVEELREEQGTGALSDVILSRLSDHG
jgi:ABC-2 type transport system ATP-binding protein